MQTKNRVFKSTLAIILGLLISITLPLITNQLVRTLDAYPEGSPGLAFVYSLAYVVFGSFITAILAPNFPKRHAMVVGVTMLLLYTISLASVTSSAYFLDFPRWYFYGLPILVMPSAFLGEALHHRLHVKDKEYEQTKASNTYRGLQIVFLFVLVIAIWFILYSIIMTVGIYSGLCYWEFIPSSSCIKGTAVFSTIIDLIIIVIIFLNKRSKRNDKDDHKSDEDDYNEKLHFME